MFDLDATDLERSEHLKHIKERFFHFELMEQNAMCKLF